MSHDTYDLRIRHRNDTVADVRAIIDPHNPEDIRQHLLAVMLDKRGHDEDRVGEYEVEVREPDETYIEFTYRTIPSGR